MKRRSPRLKRAFALPMVLLLMLAATVGIIVILERQAAHSLAVKRQLDGYREHHGMRGLVESLNAWLQTISSMTIPDLIAADPHLLDLPLADGATISISLADGQGTILSNFNGLRGDEPQTGQAVYDALEAIVGVEGMASFVRDAGPIAVSVASAPDEVIQAACAYIVEGDKAERLADNIIRERTRAALTAANLATMAGELGLTPEERSRLNQVLTDRPTIWEMEVLQLVPATPGSPARVTSAYEAGVQINGTRATILWFVPKTIE